MLNEGIDDLIETALIEKGDPLQLSLFSLEDLIFELIKRAQNMAFSKGLTELKVEIDSTLPLIWTDRKKLKRILLNIVDNAVRYTEKGVIVIRAFHEREKQSVIITVKDSGPGIPSSIASSILDRFPNGFSQRDPNSSGVGLYLSKKIIDLLNGEIWFQSDPGIGTTFFISIPLKEKSECEHFSFLRP